MQPLLSREESRAVDVAAIKAGVPGIVLMENAGRGAADSIECSFPTELERVVIFGGLGNNGGDGWVLARHLTLRGYSPRVLACGEPSKFKANAAANWNALQALGIPCEVIDLEDHAACTKIIEGATLVVDGLFGTGLDRAIQHDFAELVRSISAAANVVSLDVPSGIDADTGQVLGEAVRADLTVTFAAHKRGLHQHPGVEFAGHVELVDIGVPGTNESDAWLIDEDDLPHLIVSRSGNAHKNSAGHLLVVGGSPGKTGAALLAGRAAFRAGAGLVTIATRSDARAALDEKVVELMTAELSEDPEAIQTACQGKAAVIVGPGLGLDAEGKRLSLQCMLESPLPTVIDADALTHLADIGIGELKSAAGPRVITPHPGEAARLLNIMSGEVQADRFAAAARLQSLCGHVVVLKGARTIVAGFGSTYVCARGTPALAVAGTGDVLSGILGVMQQQIEDDPALAAITGVLLHAMAGERAAVADRGLLASEVADALPSVFAEFDLMTA